MLEKQAALVHDMWASWTKYMLNNMTDGNVKRWLRQIDTPYEELSETEKDSDREWARKVLEIKELPAPWCESCALRTPYADSVLIKVKGTVGLNAGTVPAERLDVSRAADQEKKSSKKGLT